MIADPGTATAELPLVVAIATDDEADRRKVFMMPVPERMMEMGRPYELVKRAMQKQSEAYSDAELKFLIRYGSESYYSMLESTTRFRAQVKAAQSRAKPVRVPKPTP